MSPLLQQTNDLFAPTLAPLHMDAITEPIDDTDNEHDEDIPKRRNYEDNKGTKYQALYKSSIW